jgi:hypothetical protein
MKRRGKEISNEKLKKALMVVDLFFILIAIFSLFCIIYFICLKVGVLTLNYIFPSQIKLNALMVNLGLLVFVLFIFRRTKKKNSFVAKSIKFMLTIADLYPTP